MMMTVSLFLATVLIWGSTWIAIAWQVGPVPVVQSVFLRFAIAAAVLLGVLALTGRLRRPPIWRFIVFQALCLFSLNFLCFYTAVAFVPSGLVAVVFSLASLFNAVNARLFFGEPISTRVLTAGAIGVAGVALMLWPEADAARGPDMLRGLGWAVAGCIFFSLGNMASRANSARGISPVTANAWGMPIGTAVLLLAMLGQGVTWTPPSGALYFGALIYLAVVGTVIGFTTYLMLVARIGSAQAGYATVFFPVVALALSSVFEDYEWSFLAVFGLILTGFGNMILFRR